MSVWLILEIRLITLKGNKIAQHCRLEATIHRVRPRFFDQVGHDTMYASSGNKHYFTK